MKHEGIQSYIVMMVWMESPGKVIMWKKSPGNAI